MWKKLTFAHLREPSDKHWNIFRKRKTFMSGVKFEAVTPAFEVSNFVRCLAR